MNETDYSKVDIYSKQYFELYSERRDISFRYAKYDGYNYEKICDYIHELSNYTEIWDREKLRKGSVYTFSGRTYEFMEVDSYSLRCCIANNPYIMIDNKKTALVLSTNEADEYLRQDPTHIVFAYEEICNDYKYDPLSNSYIIYSKDHPQGLKISELPKGKEWYIGGKDNMRYLRKYAKPAYDESTHTVHLEIDLQVIVNKCLTKIYEINNFYMGKEKNGCLLKPSWKDYYYYRMLFDKYNSKEKFVKFIEALSHYTDKVSKDADVEKWLKLNKQESVLSDKNNLIVYHVDIYQNYYKSGQQTNNIENLWKHYLKINIEPRQNDFKIIQFELLKQYLILLSDLHNKTCKRVHTGLICKDENNNLFCGDIMLSKAYNDYVGVNCQISNYGKNKEKNLYKYYCNWVDYLEIHIEGYLKFIGGKWSCRAPKPDMFKFVIFDKVKMIDQSFNGCKVEIEKISISSNKQKGVFAVVKEFTIILKEEIKGKIILEKGTLYFMSEDFRFILLYNKFVNLVDCRISIKSIMYKYGEDCFDCEFQVIEPGRKTNELTTTELGYCLEWKDLQQKLSDEDGVSFTKLFNTLIEKGLLIKNNKGKLYPSEQMKQAGLGYISHAITIKYNIPANKLVQIFAKKDDNVKPFNANDHSAARSRAKQIEKSDLKLKQIIDDILNSCNIPIPQI